MYKFIFRQKLLIIKVNTTTFGPVGYSKSLIFKTNSQINPKLNLPTMLIFEDEIRIVACQMDTNVSTNLNLPSEIIISAEIKLSKLTMSPPYVGSDICKTKKKLHLV